MRCLSKKREPHRPCPPEHASCIASMIGCSVFLNEIREQSYHSRIKTLDYDIGHHAASISDPAWRFGCSSKGYDELLSLVLLEPFRTASFAKPSQTEHCVCRSIVS